MSSKFVKQFPRLRIHFKAAGCSFGRRRQQKCFSPSPWVENGRQFGDLAPHLPGPSFPRNHDCTTNEEMFFHAGV